MRITVTFEAFDTNGVSLGQVVNSFYDGNYFGEPDDDRFYGVEYSGGIGSIAINYSSSTFEVDHIQYSSFNPVPLLTTAGLAGVGLMGLGVRRRRAGRL